MKENRRKQFFIKNRRGFLLAEETLKIILAVIAISFLAYFLTSLYFNSINNQKTVNAEASFERIKDVIKNQESTNETVLDITPPSWSLFSFVGEEKPNSCSGQDCLCLCYHIKLNFGSRQIKECDKKSICEIVPGLEDFEEIKIKSPSISIEVLKLGDKIIIREK